MERTIKTQEQWVLFRLEKFYANEDNLTLVRSILDGSSNLSLRLIDWFVTNYSKKYNTSYVTNEKKHIVVYLSYKSHLKAYSKKMFDPFCRWKRIQFQEMETTVGQLNFFEWAITDGVLKYILDNHELIHKDMESRIHSDKDEDTTKKRHELSRSATNSLKRHNVHTVVKFD
jgi:hypothetical protein